jgi:hypothetical protein
MRDSAPHRSQETSCESNGEGRQFLVCLKKCTFPRILWSRRPPLIASLRRCGAAECASRLGWVRARRPLPRHPACLLRASPFAVLDLDVAGHAWAMPAAQREEGGLLAPGVE